MINHKKNFADLPDEYTLYKPAKVAIVPAPYDKTSTWIKGAHRGPEAIIDASANLELYDIETGTEVYKLGIFTNRPTIEAVSPEKVISLVRETVCGHLKKNKFVVTLGGEHTVSIGAIEAHHEKYENLTVLQLDAHADLRENYCGSRYNHACVMKRVKELCPIVQVGIRSMDVSEEDEIDENRVFFAEDIHRKDGWIEEVIPLLGEHVYITIDLDVFDISIMPSTGTPEPGGLFWYEVLKLLKRVAKERTIIGFDVVELCPNELSKPYDFLAAKLIYKLLSYKFYGGSK